MTMPATTLTVLATVALALVATPRPAEAHHPHHNHHHHRHIGFFAPSYAFYATNLAYGGCYWTRVRIWDGFSWRLRRAQICN
jgi:hypothetical protein